MPIALIILGAMLTVAGIRGNARELGSLVASDFSGQDNFAVWVLAIFAVGSVGYIRPLKPLSDGFLVLILMVILISNDQNGNGFFSQLQTAVKNTGVASTPNLTGLTQLVQPSTTTS